VPELRDVPADRIHAPWESPLLPSRSGYPPPIVDHDVQRRRCLEMFQAVKWKPKAAEKEEETE
jgi:deoxyribodipyrimidine photo-lyase